MRRSESLSCTHMDVKSAYRKLTQCRKTPAVGARSGRQGVWYWVDFRVVRYWMSEFRLAICAFMRSNPHDGRQEKCILLANRGQISRCPSPRP